ncbi:hypothetical protein EI94DRAFT_1748907 [Lactarius quietus]|nr:hypothetical protein EI94DRAFT_1748907 [Lactarius quietus]
MWGQAFLFPPDTHTRMPHAPEPKDWITQMESRPVVYLPCAQRAVTLLPKQNNRRLCPNIGNRCRGRGHHKPIVIIMISTHENRLRPSAVVLGLVQMRTKPRVAARTEVFLFCSVLFCFCSSDFERSRVQCPRNDSANGPGISGATHVPFWPYAGRAWQNKTKTLHYSV